MRLVRRIALCGTALLLAAAVLVTQSSMRLDGSLDLYGVRKMTCCPERVVTETPIATFDKPKPACCMSDGPASTLVDVDFDSGADFGPVLGLAATHAIDAPMPHRVDVIRPRGLLPPARAPPTRTIVLLI